MPQLMHCNVQPKKES